MAVSPTAKPWSTLPGMKCSAGSRCAVSTAWPRACLESSGFAGRRDGGRRGRGRGRTAAAAGRALAPTTWFFLITIAGSVFLTTIPAAAPPRPRPRPRPIGCGGGRRMTLRGPNAPMIAACDRNALRQRTPNGRENKAIGTVQTQRNSEEAKLLRCCCKHGAAADRPDHQHHEPRKSQRKTRKSQRARRWLAHL